MTRKEFTARTGREPEQDDLERVNCEYAGYPNHLGCGWCCTHNAPMFQCGCLLRGHTAGHRVIFEGKATLNAV